LLTIIMKLAYVIVALVAAIYFEEESLVDATYPASSYCSAIGNSAHTTCKANSSNLDSLNFPSQTEKDEILDLHNLARNNVGLANETGFTATNMAKLYYDTHLEAIAAQLAATCVFSHDSSANRNLPELWEKTGQNLYVSSSTSQSYDAAIRKWWDEVYVYDYTSNESINGSAVGHYTQMIWAETTHVGCAKATCSKVLNSAGTNLFTQAWATGPESLVVCNYAPAGNWIGVHPFISGAPASACPNNVDSTYPNLCDCNDKVCGTGTLNVATCGCNCPSNTRPADCIKDCSATDNPSCGLYMDAGYCDINVYPQYWAFMTGTCPNSCPGPCQLPPPSYFWIPSA
jgi:hypothetical protein